MIFELFIPGTIQGDGASCYVLCPYSGGDNFFYLISWLSELLSVSLQKILKNMNMNDEEIWMDIEGYEGYQVSNLGRARSLDRIDSLGRLWKGKIRKPFSDKDGYQLVQLCKDGKRKAFLVHRLIYEAFCGKIPSGMQVNHINECKTDNRLCNLNLMTPKENTNWGTRTERSAKAQSKPVIGIDENGDIIVTFPSAREAGRNGYDQSHISACCRGKKPSHKGLIWRYANGTA